MIEDESCNIFENIKADDFNKMRKYIVENILYTDMTKHFQVMGEIKTWPTKDDFEPSGKHKHDIMKALVHAGDVGNPSRPFNICKEWALKILSEFFMQVSLHFMN